MNARCGRQGWCSRQRGRKPSPADAPALHSGAGERGGPQAQKSGSTQAAPRWQVRVRRLAAPCGTSLPAAAARFRNTFSSQAQERLVLQDGLEQELRTAGGTTRAVLEKLQALHRSPAARKDLADRVHARRAERKGARSDKEPSASTSAGRACHITCLPGEPRTDVCTRHA